MARFWCLLILCVFVQIVFGQQDKNNKDNIVKGAVFFEEPREAVISGSVVFKLASDSTFVKGVSTKDNGSFAINIPSADYLIEYSYMGYQKSIVHKQIHSSLTLDTVYLEERSVSLSDVEIIANMPPVSVNGDTIEFNSSAYNIDGSTKLKDFVLQIPGLQFDPNGGLKYGGKAIDKILLDGKEYFGNDIKMALNNLPANMISKLQLFKKESEESKASGIKDVEPAQVLNVSVKEDYKKSIFGDAKAGMGSRDRYTTALNLNKLHEDNQFVLNGTINNINDSEYRYYADFDDNITKNIGGNINLQSSEKVSWNASVNYSDYKSNDQYRSDSYTSILKQYNYREGRGISRQDNLSFNSNLNLKPDSLTYISLVTTMTVTDGSSINNSIDSANIVDKSTTRSKTFSQNNNNGINLYNQLVVSRRTSSGRSLTLSFGQQYDNTKGTGNNLSEKVYYESAVHDTLDQRSKTKNNSQGFDLSARYVEPIGKQNKLYLSYYYSYRQSLRDGDTRRLDSITHEYSIVDTAYTRKTTSKIFKHDIRLGFQHTQEKVNVNVNFTLSPTDMRNKTMLQDIVKEDTIQRVVNYSPSFRLNWMPSSSVNVGFNYQGNTRYPSLTQLSGDTVVVSTMVKNIGNPNLKINFVHRVGIDFYASDFESGRSFNMNVSYSQSTNATVRSTFVDDHSNSINTYVNSNGIYDGYIYSSFTTPLKNKNITLGINANGNTSRNVTYLNNQKNILKNNSFTVGGMFLLYSSLVECNLNLSSTFSYSNNNLADVSFSKTTDYALSNTTKFKAKYDFILESILNMSYRTGYGEGVRKSETLWNVSLSKLIMKDKRGQIKLEVYDLLNNYRTQENKVSGSDYSNYWRKVINNYFMASFIYRFDLRNR